MDNLDLLYSLFNQYVFQDAKNNIESLEYYFNTNPSTSGNSLIDGLLGAIKSYSFETIDIPLFQSILQRDGKNPREQQEILDRILQWKNYSRQQMGPTKDYLRDICAGTVLQKAYNKYSGSPFEIYQYLKNSDLKLDNSDILSSMEFDKIDLGSILEKDKANGGFKSYFRWVNDLFDPAHMYENGQMVLVTMPPGCCSGDTEVFLSDGTIMTIKELYDLEKHDIGIYSNNENGNTEKTEANSCQISKYVSSWYVVSIGDKEFRVTENHPFLLIGNKWARADELKIGDTLVGFAKDYTKEFDYKISKIRIETLSSPQPVYDLVNAGKHHNYAVSIDGNHGVFFHNTGKTLWMMTEALNMALTTNAKIHYLAMGDMKPKDFIVRMGAIYTGKSFGEVTQNIVPIYNTLKNFIRDRLEISVIPAGQITSEEYVEYVRSKDYDVVFIDYDSNFKLKESDSMYNDFGVVYNSLTKLTQDGRLVFIAAQPKIQTWGNSTIELGDVGESSRKIHTVDILFTAGKLDCPNHLGIFKCCKNRRGEEGGKIGYIRLSNGRFKFIPVEIAKQLAQSQEKKMFTEADIDLVVRNYENVLRNQGIDPGTGRDLNQGASRINNPFK